MYVYSHGLRSPYLSKQVKTIHPALGSVSKPISIRFKGGPPEPPEDLKPFYNRKLIKNPTLLQKALYLTTGISLAIGFSSLVGMLCPVLAPVAGLFSGFVIVGCAIDKTLPEWEKDDLRMTTEQAVRDIQYNDKLKSYYRQEKIRVIKEKIIGFLGKCNTKLKKYLGCAVSL